MFRIGAFARLGRVSVKMLRHYDRIGLLPPAFIDPATGYRYYAAAQLARLHRVVLLRDLGFGLREIAVLADGDIDEIYAAREAALRDSIAADTARLSRLRARRAGAGADVLTRSAPGQLLATVPGRRFDELERYVRRHGARAGTPPMTLIGAEVAAAVPVTWAVPAGDGVRVSRLSPVPVMACLVYQGGYGGLSGAWQDLLGWVERAGARPGLPLREVYLRFGAEPELALHPEWLAGASAEYVTELQVPVVSGP